VSRVTEAHHIGAPGAGGRLRLLLANDDGIDAPGLHALEAALAGLGEVTTVAPATEQSARSHALTFHEPLRVRSVGERRFSVSGTPADCIYLALHHLLDAPPDVVVSGINRGSNLGNDVHYSGTVAAAREACLAGFSAVSVSLHLEPGDRERHWGTAGAVAARVVRQVLGERLPPLVHLNVNVPNVPASDVLGLRACTLGRRTYAPSVVQRRDPRGRRYFWIGGEHEHFGEDDQTDGIAVERGWASVTPICAYPTHHESLEALRDWTDA
jgi:5'-nucleotidase